MSFKPSDYIALSLVFIVLVFLILFGVSSMVMNKTSAPENLELWTALVGSIITGVLMYLNKGDK